MSSAPQQDPSGTPRRVSSIDELAGRLQERGVGPVSRMCTEILLETEVGNVELPELHRVEGNKFAAMAEKIIPPYLVAEYIKEKSVPFPMVGVVGSEVIVDAFETILKLTKFPSLRTSFFRYPVTDSENYFKFCVKDSSLLLSCFYLSAALQVYVQDLNQRISNDQVNDVLSAFGKHFSSTNLVAVFPMALHVALSEAHGPDAQFRQVDKNVVQNSLKALHDNNQFVIRSKGTKETGLDHVKIALRCPMEGYLSRLLVRNNALEPIIDGICLMNELIEEPGGPWSTIAQLKAHSDNQKIVALAASRMLRRFESRS